MKKIRVTLGFAAVVCLLGLVNGSCLVKTSLLVAYGNVYSRVGVGGLWGWGASENNRAPG